MTVAEQSHEELLHELQLLQPEELAAVVEQLIGAPQADFGSAVRVFLRAALSAEADVERLSGGPAEVRTELDRLLKDQRIKAEARRVVLDQPLLDSSVVGAALGMRGKNQREAASDLRRAGSLLGIPDRNRFLYPQFQFNLERACVHRTVSEVNALLGAKDDPWGAASWWISDNPRLGGQRPQDLIGTKSEPDVLAVAAGDDD